MGSKSNNRFGVFYSIVSFFIRSLFFLRIYNLLYERSPQAFVNFLHQRIKLPNKSFVWVIHLLNKKRIKTRVYKNDLKTLEFAVDYRWYAPGISIIENEILNFLRKDLTYIDIGANLGMRSLVALSLKIPTIMCEPNHAVCDLNEERCRINRFTNYSIIRKGISNGIGEKEFHIDETSYLSSFNMCSKYKYESSISVNVTTVDEILKDVLICNIFIKIDVEGHELSVIEGAQQTIAKYKPTMIVEINEKEKNFDSIFILLKSFNYKLFTINASQKSTKLLREIVNGNETEHINSATDFLCVSDERTMHYLSSYVF